MHIVPRRPRGRPRHGGTFSPGESRVLAGLRAGQTNAEIAEGLGLSVHTVRSHVSRILAKLNVTSRRELLLSKRRGEGGAATTVLRCSFCQKTESHVRYLLASPAGVYICGECVGICNAIIAKESESADGA